MKTVSAESNDEKDPFSWLEDVESERALNWVRAHNAPTLEGLRNDPYFKEMEPEIRKIILSKERIPFPSLRNGWIYNFWQDAEHQRGLWRRTRPDEYKKPHPSWEIILDLDALAKTESKNWVWKSAVCLPPDYERCLLSLSDAGKDAVVVREFDITKKNFVSGGFHVPEAKSSVTWKDRDTLLVGSDFGPGTLTKSGYPRIIKQWKRGTALESAPVVFEGEETDVSASGYTDFHVGGNHTFFARSPTFFTSKTWVEDETGKHVKIPLPDHADVKGVFRGDLFALLREEWKTKSGQTFSAGSLIAFPLSALKSNLPEKAVELVFAPPAGGSISEISISDNYFFLDVLENVKGRILRGSKLGGWKFDTLPFEDNGTVSVVALDEKTDDLIVKYESFLTPPSLYALTGSAAEIGNPIKQLPQRFDPTPYVVRQVRATSADGTKVPYFIVHRKDIAFDGKTPTLLYGYGGFEVSLTPSYLAARGKAWLEKGGAYVLANIRGGGEFGPQWHQAAMNSHRQRAFDDFIAVAEDLVRTKVTSPDHLGISGGSNGGLLVGAVFTQRPELFNAVVCAVPLLDMLRFHKLLAGNSWMGEYGNPDVPAEAAYLKKYSPYHNVKLGVHYPKVYFFTSTRDDRVHPGHARKMVAKMESQGHPVLYYENIEGGHGGAANLDQAVLNYALECTYLVQQLVRNGAETPKDFWSRVVQRLHLSKPKWLRLGK